MVGFFDTNIWWNLNSLSFLDTATGVGEFLHDQILTGRIITPRDVYEELKSRPAEKAWLDLVPSGIRDLDSDDLSSLSDIVNNYPDFLDASKPTGKDADHPLVAMALTHHRTGTSPAMVVTQERWRKVGEHRWHIPDVCHALGLPCGDFQQWLAVSGYRISVEPIR